MPLRGGIILSLALQLLLFVNSVAQADDACINRAKGEFVNCNARAVAAGNPAGQDACAKVLEAAWNRCLSGGNNSNNNSNDNARPPVDTARRDEQERQLVEQEARTKVEIAALQRRQRRDDRVRMRQSADPKFDETRSGCNSVFLQRKKEGDLCGLGERAKAITGGSRQSAPSANQTARSPAPENLSTDPIELAGQIISALGRKPPTGQAKSGTNPSADAPIVEADPVEQAKPARQQSTGPANVQNAPMVGACMSYFATRRRDYQKNAASCFAETRLIQSLTDSVFPDPGSNTQASGDPNFTDAVRETKLHRPLIGIVEPGDPGWTINDDDTLTPKCNVPISVYAQNQSFSECARVYVCALNTASCGYRQAAKSILTDCAAISRACLTYNPIPQPGDVSQDARRRGPLSNPQPPVTGLTGNKSEVSGSANAGDDRDSILADNMKAGWGLPPGLLSDPAK